MIVIKDANSDSTDEHFTSLVADTALQDVVHHHAPGLIDQKIGTWKKNARLYFGVRGCSHI